jgi:hypothetical protein
MAGTFSINIGGVTEATSYRLVGGTGPSPDYITDILDRLEDNTNKQLTPSALRDTILTLYSSVPFKETSPTGSTTQYIGIDTLDPSGKDLKKKILIGKRAFSGTFSYQPQFDIMTSTLYGSDVDTFLYNTKIDTINQLTTRVGILAGTDSNVFNLYPFFQSQRVTGASDSLSLDFVNQSGDVKLLSEYGNVLINGTEFPSITQSVASASNNRVLFYENGSLVWGDITLPNLSTLGNTGSQIDIYGTPVNVNGYPLEFSDSRMVPIAFSDISTGSTFSNQPVSEMIRRLIYPYLGPLCSIEILPPYNTGYVEVGSFPTPTIQFTILKRTLPTLLTGLGNMIPSIYPAIASSGQTSVTTTSNGIVISPVTATATIFSVNVSDGTQSSTATASIEGIYPFFYGFSTVANMNSIALAGLTKLVEPKGDKTIDISGTGNYYFVYDYNYGTLSNIYDASGNTASASFSATYSVLSSPTGLWAGKQFYVYQWNSVPQIGPPSENFQFQF